MPYKDPEAKRAYHKRWYEANKEKRQEQIKAYKRDNAESVAFADALYRARPEVRQASTVRKREWRAANPEHEKHFKRIWAKRNRQRIQEYNRARPDRSEYNKAYYEANRERLAQRERVRYITRRDSVTNEQVMAAMGKKAA